MPGPPLNQPAETVGLVIRDLGLGLANQSLMLDPSHVLKKQTGIEGGGINPLLAESPSAPAKERGKGLSRHPLQRRPATQPDAPS